MNKLSLNDIPFVTMHTKISAPLLFFILCKPYFIKIWFYPFIFLK